MIPIRAAEPVPNIFGLLDLFKDRSCENILNLEVFAIDVEYMPQPSSPEPHVLFNMHTTDHRTEYRLEMRPRELNTTVSDVWLTQITAVSNPCRLAFEFKLQKKRVTIRELLQILCGNWKYAPCLTGLQGVEHIVKGNLTDFVYSRDPNGGPHVFGRRDFIIQCFMRLYRCRLVKFDADKGPFNFTPAREQTDTDFKVIIGNNYTATTMIGQDSPSFITITPLKVEKGGFLLQKTDTEEFMIERVESGPGIDLYEPNNQDTRVAVFRADNDFYVAGRRWW